MSFPCCRRWCISNGAEMNSQSHPKKNKNAEGLLIYPAFLRSNDLAKMRKFISPPHTFLFPKISYRCLPLQVYKNILHLQCLLCSTALPSIPQIVFVGTAESPCLEDGLSAAPTFMVMIISSTKSFLCR
jgi:hypothetical protein